MEIVSEWKIFQIKLSKIIFKINKILSQNVMKIKMKNMNTYKNLNKM